VQSAAPKGGARRFAIVGSIWEFAQDFSSAQRIKRDNAAETWRRFALIGAQLIIGWMPPRSDSASVMMREKFIDTL